MVKPRIIGNEQAVRAIEIAARGQHTLKLIGGTETRPLADYAQSLGVEVSVFKPCPCGYLGHPRLACTCEAQQLRQYAQHISRKVADLVVTTTPPAIDSVIAALKAEWHGRVSGDEGWQLLKLGCEKLGLEASQAETILKVANSIRALGSGQPDKIQAVHIAEALQYCQRPDQA